MVDVYSVAIHNRRVRRAVRDGGHYDGLSDGWAYTNYLTVEAGSREEALDRIEVNLPSGNGYVIDSIELSHDYGWGKLDR